MPVCRLARDPLRGLPGRSQPAEVIVRAGLYWVIGSGLPSHFSPGQLLVSGFLRIPAQVLTLVCFVCQVRSHLPRLLSSFMKQQADGG